MQNLCRLTVLWRLQAAETYADLQHPGLSRHSQRLLQACASGMVSQTNLSRLGDARHGPRFVLGTSNV